MTNGNCLAGVRCPRCEQEERFRITALVTCEVTDDGSEAGGDHVWDGASATFCPEWGHAGPLREFRERSALPPDPEGMNDERAVWAGSALTAFMRITGTDEEDAVGDLLTDLMHWCDRNSYDFGLALGRAEGHYAAETGGEESR